MARMRRVRGRVRADEEREQVLLRGAVRSGLRAGGLGLGEERAADPVHRRARPAHDAVPRRREVAQGRDDALRDGP
jgi:hypothetical protein